MKVPRVVLFATGGTISSLVPAGKERGYTSSLSGSQILDRVIGFERLAKVEIVDFSRIPSQDMTIDSSVTLCRQVAAALEEPEVDGVLITHGTGTLEDTCFLLDLFITSDKPVIGTGAMVNASMPDWDGRRNILNSLRVIGCPDARGKGVMVCLNGELHAARDVMKVHPSSLGAFASPVLGLLGIVNEEHAIFYRAPLRRFAFSNIDLVPDVAVVKVVQGSDDRLFRAALELGARGVVIEGFGGSGTIPSWFLPTIAEARRRGVPIVLCARTSAGRVAFGAAASQVALKEAGIIPGGTLPSHKARLVLMAALANGASEEMLRDAFRAIAG